MWYVEVFQRVKLCTNVLRQHEPDRSSILVFVSIADLCWPGTGALRGMMVGTATAPAVMVFRFLKLEALTPHTSQKSNLWTYLQTCKTKKCLYSVVYIWIYRKIPRIRPPFDAPKLMPKSRGSLIREDLTFGITKLRVMSRNT